MFILHYDIVIIFLFNLDSSSPVPSSVETRTVSCGGNKTAQQLIPQNKSTVILKIMTDVCSFAKHASK